MEDFGWEIFLWGAHFGKLSAGSGRPLLFCFGYKGATPSSFFRKKKPACQNARQRGGRQAKNRGLRKFDWEDFLLNFKEWYKI